MGRLIPVFEEQDGRMLFQGKFKDEDTNERGYLETAVETTPTAEGSSVRAATFVPEKD